MSHSNPIVQRLHKDLAPVPARPETEAVAIRLRTAFEMANAGIEMMRLNLRREHPEATPEAISEMLKLWLDSRQDDSWGRSVPDRIPGL